MNSDSDPLLRAVIDEDPACPDGRVLVALGRLIRRHSALPQAATLDVADDVLAKLSDADSADNDLIDALYDRDESTQDAGLARLGEMMRGIGPQPVDLLPRVLRNIRSSSRFGVIKSADETVVLDSTSRWRIWSAVVAGHFAALLAFAIFEVGFSERSAPSIPVVTQATPAAANAIAVGDTGGAAPAGDRNAIAPALPPHLPATWSDARNLDSDLFLLRRFPELRHDARRLYGMEASASAVSAGLIWLQAQQDPVGGCFGVLSGNGERDFATQSLAILALIGEGLGDKARTTAARRGLAWLRGQLASGDTADDRAASAHTFATYSQVTSGLVCLALVEGGLLLGDESLQQQAERSLAAIDRGQPMQAGVSGLGGFALLALETAQQGGLHVPGRLLQQARNNIARSLPADESDIGRLGLAAFARFILGHRDNPSTAHQVERLGELLPAKDAAGRVDPLGWFFATLALRENGGKSWERWADALQTNLLPLLATGATAQAHVEASKVRYGETGGDVFATSVVLLNLQAPYRYLPVAAAP